MSTMNQPSDSLTRFLRKTDLNVVEKLLKDAFLKGYHARIVAEKTLLKNPVVSIGIREWYRFNYGATWYHDRDMGASASGKSLSWFEAKVIPYCKLPSKKDFETLLEYTVIDVEYNVGLDHEPWNSRVVLSDNHHMISFYAWGSYYPDNSDEKGRLIVQCWLNDEIDEETALSVVFIIQCDQKEKVGDYNGKLIGIEYVPIPKTKKIQAHFMKSSQVPAYEDFAEFYLENQIPVTI